MIIEISRPLDETVMDFEVQILSSAPKDKMKYRLTTNLRKNIRDNQGEAVKKVLHQMGFTDVEKVRIGKTIMFECDGRRINLPEQVADKLVNLVMEDYTIEKLD